MNQHHLAAFLVMMEQDGFDIFQEDGAFTIQLQGSRHQGFHSPGSAMQWLVFVLRGGTDGEHMGQA